MDPVCDNEIQHCAIITVICMRAGDVTWPHQPHTYYSGNLHVGGDVTWPPPTPPKPKPFTPNPAGWPANGDEVA